jgi:hypothetical protein
LRPWNSWSRDSDFIFTGGLNILSVIHLGLLLQGTVTLEALTPSEMCHIQG